MTKTDYFIDCTTLDEARKTYYRLAMKFHPDKGGDEEKFKELANQFHSFKPSQFKYEKEFNDWSSKAYSDIIVALKQLNRYNLLIFDDFGLKPLSHDARLTLLDILEDRYEGAATIFTSQLPLDKWYDYINEPSLADAIIGRLSASAHKIKLRGESWRNKKIK